MIITPSQYSRGSGFEVIPSPPQLGINLFQADTEENAKLARDTYFSSNPTELARYDNNPLRMIQVSWSSPAPVFEFESRVSGNWVNTFTQTVEDFQLGTHSVTELNDVTSAGSGQIITNSERTKLAGVATEATKNQTDSYLLDRTNHTGTQAISTVNGLQTALDSKQDTINGLTVHRFIQISNGTNSTITSNNINITNILPLLGTGTFNASFNNPTGYGSADFVNNWIDVSNINSNANFLIRATLTNNGVGTVTDATLVARLITNKSNPTVFTDILNVPESFGTQAAFITMAFSGGIEAIQIGIRTAQTENIRLNGCYLVITDPIVIP